MLVLDLWPKVQFPHLLEVKLFSREFETIPEIYRIIDVEIITEYCYGLPNIARLNETQFQKWIILENRYRWGQKFQK